MKTFKNHYHLSILLVIFLLLCLQTSINEDFQFSAARADPPGAINWIEHDEGLEIAKQKKLPVLVYFWSEKCGACRVMEKVTFQDPEVVAYINKNMIPIHVDVFKWPVLSRRYRIRTTPTTFFVTSESQMIDSLVGNVPPERFKLALRFYCEGHYKKMSFKKFEKKHGN